MRTVYPIIRCSLASPMYLLLAAVVGASCFLLYQGFRTERYLSTAQLRLIDIRDNGQDPHLSHQSDAQKLNPEAIAKRLVDPKIAISLPWWYEFQTQALEAIGLNQIETIDLEQQQEIVKKVLTHVRAEVLADGSTIAISYTGQNPALTALVANAIARSAITDATRMLAEKRAAYVSFLEAQVQSAEKELQNTTTKLDTTPNSMKAYNTQQATKQKLAALESALKQLTGERIELETKLRSETNTAFEVGDQDYMLALQQRILDVDLTISVEAKELGSRHPKMVSLRAERNRLEQLISAQQQSSQSDASKLLAALGAQEEALRREIITIRNTLDRFRSESKSYTDAKIELASLHDAKKWWSTQLSYARTQLGSFASPLSLQVPASIPTQELNPISYVTMLWCALAAMLVSWIYKIYSLISSRRFVSIKHAQSYLGTEPVAVLPLVEGLFISQALEYQAGGILLNESDNDRTVEDTIESNVVGHTPETLQLTESQIVAANCDDSDICSKPITISNSSNSQFVHLLPKMIVTEACNNLLIPSELGHSFRHLQNRLTFQLPPSANTIAVTSAIPFEGKSTVASQVAVSMAKAGYKTVVIDTSVIYTTNRHRVPGLAEFLAGEMKVEDILMCSSTSGLWNIGAGNCTEDTRSLIYSREFRELLETLAQCFEYVVIDCPAISVAAESLYIADQADAYLLISDFEIGDRHATKLALQQLEKTASINGGLVLNRYDVGHSGVPEQISVLAG